MARNKIQDLRDHLFETIELLKINKLDIDKAKAIADVAQVIVNTAKVEVDFLRAKDKLDGYYPSTGFIEPEQKKLN